MKACTDLALGVTAEALRALRRGDQPWIQAHLALAAFIENSAVPIIGKYQPRNLVFYRRRHRQYARRYVIPRDPRTHAQQHVRAMMGLLSQQWQRLTGEQRRAWIAVAKQVLSRLRLTRGPLTGEMLFLKLNFVLWLLGRELLLWPSPPVVFGSNPVGELLIRREHRRLRLKLRVVGPVVDDIMVYGEAPVSPGRNKPRHPVFLGLLPTPVGGWSDITNQYAARFGLPEVGKKVIICTRQQRDGWENPYTQVSGMVVPARPVVAPRQTPRTTRTGLGLGLGFRGLGELVGVPEFHGLELNQLLGLPGLQEIPRFPLPLLGRAPGRKLVTPAAPRNHPGSAPMCTAKTPEIAALPSRSTLHAPRFTPPPHLPHRPGACPRQPAPNPPQMPLALPLARHLAAQAPANLTNHASRFTPWPGNSPCNHPPARFHGRRCRANFAKPTVHGAVYSFRRIVILLGITDDSHNPRNNVAQSVA